MMRLRLLLACMFNVIAGFCLGSHLPISFLFFMTCGCLVVNPLAKFISDKGDGAV
jgi:hypothetical protein